MRASRIPCARCRRIATSWTTRWPRSSAPPRRKRASGCTGPPPTPGPSPRRDDRGARPRQGLRRGSRAGRPRPRCGRGRVFWLPRTERRREDHDGPPPRRADGGARSPGTARVVAVHPGPARGVGDDRVPDDALRGGGGAVRPRGRARSRSPRRAGDSRRAEARRRGGVARGGVSGAHRATARRGGRGGGPAGALAMARAVWGIVAREFVRFLRQRGRLMSSLARPFVWFVFAGAGFRALFARPPGLDYPRYMAPGLLGMVGLLGAFLAALSTATDRRA